MGEAKMWYLVAYDIREPQRWRKAHKLLQSYGERVQLSIFRCWLSQRQREKLRWELEEVLTSEDSLLLAGLCRCCVERLVQCNRPHIWPLEGDCHQIF